MKCFQLRQLLKGWRQLRYCSNLFSTRSMKRAKISCYVPSPLLLKIYTCTCVFGRRCDCFWQQRLWSFLFFFCFNVRTLSYIIISKWEFKVTCPKCLSVRQQPANEPCRSAGKTWQVALLGRNTSLLVPGPSVVWVISLNIYILNVWLTLLTTATNTHTCSHTHTQTQKVLSKGLQYQYISILNIWNCFNTTLFCSIDKLVPAALSCSLLSPTASWHTYCQARIGLPSLSLICLIIVRGKLKVQ